MEIDSHYKLQQSCAHLLECLLATYDSLCMEKRHRKSELNRTEAILLTAFVPVAKEISVFVNPTTGGWRAKYSRLAEIIGFMLNRGDDAEAAMGRYFLEHRYKAFQAPGTVPASTGKP